MGSSHQETNAVTRAETCADECAAHDTDRAVRWEEVAGFEIGAKSFQDDKGNESTSETTKDCVEHWDRGLILIGF